MLRTKHIWLKGNQVCSNRDIQKANYVIFSFLNQRYNKIICGFFLFELFSRVIDVAYWPLVNEFLF